MAIALATLSARLLAMVPAVNGQPASYDQVVKDAVAQFGADIPLHCSATISVVNGTATYALPADFAMLIQLEAVSKEATVNMTTGELVAGRLDGARERIYIEGSNLRIEPTPTYTIDRTLRYAGFYQLAADSYARLTENGARIAMLYAQHLALSAQAGVAGGGGWKYQIGDESVDKSNAGRALGEQATRLYEQYQVALRPFRRSAGGRAQYDGNGVLA